MRSFAPVSASTTKEGRGVTDIGVPDPLEPEIDVIPAIEPVPGAVELPAPAPVPERQPEPA